MSKINMDGITLKGMTFPDPDNKVGVVVTKSEFSKVKTEADYHRLNGKLFIVLCMDYIGDSVMITGKYVNSPAPRFEEWAL